jgi:hypothetical protein
MDRIVRGIPWQRAALVVALATTCGARAQESPPRNDGAKLPFGRELGAERQAAIAGAKPEASPEQIVVLRDGGVLSGQITRSGERYVLARGTGEMLIPANNVMLVAASLEDAYQERRRRLSRPTAEDHLVLAEWCLRNALMAHAARELADARSVDPQHVKLMVLERRLALASERREVQAAAPATSNPRLAEPLLTEQMQTAVNDLPNGAVELFTRRVQPVLVNNCTTTGCHQSGGAEKFQFDRAVLRGLSNRHSTMNNLAAALALIDRRQPQLSPLLTVTRRTHGGMKRPVFGPRQDAAFRHLVEWVALVTAKTSTPSSAIRATEEVELATANGNQPSRWESPVMRVERSAEDESEQAIYQESSPRDVSAEDEAQLSAADAGMVNASPLRYGTRLKRWQPRDPFDPEIFNRKYAPRTSASATARSGTNESAATPVEDAKPSTAEPSAH